MERRRPILTHKHACLLLLLTATPCTSGSQRLVPLRSHQHWGTYRASLAVALPPLSAGNPSIIFSTTVHFVHTTFQSHPSILLRP
jgi:hypothetical protein